MRIIQTPVRTRPFIGGVENYVFDLSRALALRGNSVEIICANEPASPSVSEIEGVRITRLRYLCKIANTNITPRLPLELMGRDFDILHTHLPTPWSADWSAIAAWARRKPLILTYHNDITGSGIAGPISGLYNSSALRFVLNRAERIIIAQPYYLESSRHLSKFKDKVRVVPIGVDYNRFRPLRQSINSSLVSSSSTSSSSDTSTSSSPSTSSSSSTSSLSSSPSSSISSSSPNSSSSTEGDNTIFFLSVLDEFHEYKGLSDLLAALDLVRRSVPDVKLIVGGDGALLQFYRQKAHSLGLAKHIEFLGRIAPADLVDYYNRCNVFVLPSRSSLQEGFGMVLLEAMACARPVVSTSVVGLTKDIVRNDAGIAVPPGDPEALAEAIAGLLEDRKRGALMGANGRRLVMKKYNWKVISEEMEEIYRECHEDRNHI